MPFYCIVYGLILLAVALAVAAWAIYTDSTALKAEKANAKKAWIHKQDQPIQGEEKAAIYSRMLDRGES